MMVFSDTGRGAGVATDSHSVLGPDRLGWAGLGFTLRLALMSLAAVPTLGLEIGM